MSCDHPSGATFPIGTTHVTCTATDAAGNPGSASFDVTVQDTTPPKITGVPASQTLEATGPAGAVATFGTPTATDLVDGTDPVACDHASGATYPIGTTHVTCTTVDAHLNSSSSGFDITVRDTTPPTLRLPGPITVDATGPSGAVVSFTATASDIVDVTVPVVCTPAPGTTFPAGTTTVHCTATDAHANTASGAFTIHVNGADEQLAGLLTQVTGVGPGSSLAAKVKSVRASLAAGDKASACATLTGFINEVSAQAGKKLTQPQAASFIAQATRIKAVLGC